MMRTWEWNGEHWYLDSRSIAQRVRTWLVWVGGWEKPNGTGWSLRWQHDGRLKSPAPLSLFGHRFTWYGWGWNLRVGSRWLVYSRYRHGAPAQMYLSDDGTPTRATTWLLNPPAEVRVATQANERQRHYSEHCRTPIDVAEEVAGNVWRERYSESS